MVFGRDGTRRLRTPLEASVADACNTNNWLLPHPRSEEEVDLHSFLTSIPLPSPSSGPDVFSWQTDGGTSSTFSSSKTWESLRQRAPPQPTAKFIWFSGATPQLAFHMWITNLDMAPYTNPSC